jgi:hypothetical protein
MGAQASAGVPAKPFEKPVRYRGNGHDAMTPLSARRRAKGPERYSSITKYRTDRKTRPVVAKFFGTGSMTKEMGCIPVFAIGLMGGGKA